MALKFMLDTLEGVDDATKGFYTQKDGKFVLDLDGGPDTTGLESALRAEREQRKKFEKQIKAWERTGKTPDEISELLSAAEEADRQKHEKEGNFDALLNQHKTKWEKEKADLEAELNAARSSERGAIIESSLMTELTKLGATEEGIDLLPDRLSRRIKFETEDGKRIIKIMSADGETPLAGGSKDGTATMADLVKEAIEKWPSLFKGDGRGGSGTQPNPKAGRSGVTKKSDFKTEKDRAAFVTEHGMAVYKALPD